MNIFITGASGFVGGGAARHLLAAGHTITAMSRSEKSDVIIRNLGVQPVRCELETISAEILMGNDAIIHAAAFVAPWGPKDAWFKANVLGTQAMLDAARKAQVRRFIHIGTEAGIVHGQHVHNADENYPLAPNSSYPYCATKARAEMLVRAANADDFTTIVIRPRFVWGPGDTKLLPIIETMAREGRWTWIDGGKARTSTVHIHNLAHAIELSLTKGTGGEAYFILDDGDISLREMVTAMVASKGLSLPDKSAPSWLANPFARLSERVWRLFGLSGEPPLTRHAAMMMSKNCTLLANKARETLGYAPVISREDGLSRLE